MEIIQRFVHLQTEEIEVEGKIYKRKSWFPRYHQLDAVRSIGKNVLEVGIVKTIWVQHSAGFG